MVSQKRATATGRPQGSPLHLSNVSCSIFCVCWVLGIFFVGICRNFEGKCQYFIGSQLSIQRRTQGLLRVCSAFTGPFGEDGVWRKYLYVAGLVLFGEGKVRYMNIFSTPHLHRMGL